MGRKDLDVCAADIEYEDVHLNLDCMGLLVVIVILLWSRCCLAQVR